MRSLFLLVLLAVAPAARAEIGTLEECDAAIAANPDAAREDAAQWVRLGGGAPARLCEAAALEALGAHATAAQLLTGLAENPNRAINPPIRAVILEDAARLWLVAERPDLARAALASAETLTPASPYRLVLRARAEAAEADWPATRETLDALLAADPGHALGHALRAAALRRTGDPQAALAAARRARDIAPALPEAMFEEAAALAETGETEAANALWLDLIAAHPDHALAALAQRNLQGLSAAAPEPIPPPPEPPDPGLRPRPRPPG